MHISSIEGLSLKSKNELPVSTFHWCYRFVSGRERKKDSTQATLPKWKREN